MMESIETPVSDLLKAASGYSQTTLKWVALNAVEKTADFSSSFSSRVAVLLGITIFVLFASMGAALWIGECLGHYAYGFFIIAGVYGLVALMLYIFRHAWIKKPINHFIIRKMNSLFSSHFKFESDEA